MTDMRQLLDDEMSRFEAEISSVDPGHGPGLPPLPEPPSSLKTIIGSKTFNKVQEQLDGNPQGPVSHRPMGPTLLPPPPLPNLHFNSRPDSFQKPPFMGPRSGGPGYNHDNSQFMQQRGPPPSFVPPQLSRQHGPMFPGPNRPPFMEIPHSESMDSAVIKAQPAIISKPPTVFSASPKLNKDVAGSSKKSASQSDSQGPKKKKQKTEATVSVPTTPAPVKNPERPGFAIQQTTTVTKAPPAKTSTTDEKKREKKSKKNLRYAGGQVWEDQSLSEWDSDDFRLFAGDLGNDVTDELLTRYFSHYPSFVKARVIRDKRTNKSKGYGFISFRDSADYVRSMKEINGKYVGSRPIKLRKSMWKERSLDVVQKKVKEKQLMGLK